jgi:hypothetical protein
MKLYNNTTYSVAARRGKSSGGRGGGALKMGECGKTFRIIDDQNINK